MHGIVMIWYIYICTQLYLPETYSREEDAKNVGSEITAQMADRRVPKPIRTVSIIIYIIYNIMSARVVHIIIIIIPIGNIMDI